jgi:L-asparaginase
MQTLAVSHPSAAALQKIVLLATGGTIAGLSAHAHDNVNYQAGQLNPNELLAHVPALNGLGMEADCVAQLDSKDMDAATWQALVAAVVHHSAREDVAGIVITHGTDTLEETAYLLHRVILPVKPVALTAAMRPATSIQSDGPQNLTDAVHWIQYAAQQPHLAGAGVVVAMASQIWSAAEVRKIHPYRLDPLSAGDAGPVGWVREGQVQWLRALPVAGPSILAIHQKLLQLNPEHWPRVVLIDSHGGMDRVWLKHWSDLVITAQVQGVIAVGTGNGTLHQHLQTALARLTEQGVAVRVCTRCIAGSLVPGQVLSGALLPLPGLTPAQARVELMLDLISQGKYQSAASQVG